MDSFFNQDEKLYRAVYPPEIQNLFWKSDGSVSSAAFADPKGLSVDRGYYRGDDEVMIDMSKRFRGRIVRLSVADCNGVDAFIKYCPSRKNIYHSEIHGSRDCILLSKRQRVILASKAIIL